MPRTVLIATCSNRKKLEPQPKLRLGSINGSLNGSRFPTWRRRLEESPAEERLAADLYGGGHWSVARELGARLGDGAAWVMSAGYGLVPFDAPLKPYSATFTMGQPDSVTDAGGSDERAAALRDWWKRLQSWRGPVEGSPRSIRELVDRNPRATFVIVASRRYLEAACQDLRVAYQDHRAPGRFVIVSSSPPRGLSNVIAVDARLEGQVGGTRGELNIRAARLLLVELGRELDYERARAILAERSKGKRVRAFHRDRHSDDEVREFIRSQIGPGTSASMLLRRFRDAGQACEQSRFRQLYREVEEEVDVR